MGRDGRFYVSTDRDAPRGRLAMAGLTRLMDAGPAIAPGVHPLAVVDPTAELGDGAAVGPFVVIGATAGPCAESWGLSM